MWTEMSRALQAASRAAGAVASGHRLRRSQFTGLCAFESAKKKAPVKGARSGKPALCATAS